jgi:hypothetical protein
MRTSLAVASTGCGPDADPAAVAGERAPVPGFAFASAATGVSWIVSGVGML